MRPNHFGKLVLLVVLTLTPAMGSRAQDLKPNLKFGAPTQEELSLKAYAPDKEAAAVTLYSNIEKKYDITPNGLELITEVERRIKILKPEGKKKADNSIVYYQPLRGSKETILGLKATAYNLEDGKVVKTKMERSMVSTEKLDDKRMIIKFTVPNVKEGTVIEYSYTKHSEYFYQLDTWYAQENIPVLYSRLSMVIPDFFIFNCQESGGYTLEHHITPENTNIAIRGTLYNGEGRRQEWVAHQLPAARETEYVYYPNDFLAKVDFELSSINIVGFLTKNFATKWDEVTEILLDDSDFGNRLSQSNPLKSEQEALALDPKLTVTQKVAALYGLLKKKVRWNGDYRLTGKNGKKTLDEGTGSNADINFVLMSMLRDAGLKTYPALLSTRDNGRLPFYPSLQSLNTFVVAVEENDTTMHYFDGSAEDGYIDMLPTTLLTNRAYILKGKNNNCWANIQQLAHDKQVIGINGVIDASGQIKGNCIVNHYDEGAYLFKNKYRKAKDNNAYIQQLGSDNKLHIANYTTEGSDTLSPRATETFEFTKQCDVADDRIYVNPIILPIESSNPFTSETRILPIEFPCPKTLFQTVTLKIPEGYGVEELPKGVVTYIGDKEATFSFKCAISDRHIICNYQLNLKRAFFGPEEYEYLKNYFQTIVLRNEDMVVLKKGDGHA